MKALSDEFIKDTVSHRKRLSENIMFLKHERNELTLRLKELEPFCPVHLSLDSTLKVALNSLKSFEVSVAV
jgi:hypothetical protein